MSYYIDACRASGTLVSMVTSILGYLIIHGLKVTVFHQQFTLYAGNSFSESHCFDLTRSIFHLILFGGLFSLFDLTRRIFHLILFGGLFFTVLDLTSCTFHLVPSGI